MLLYNKGTNTELETSDIRDSSGRPNAVIRGLGTSEASGGFIFVLVYDSTSGQWWIQMLNSFAFACFLPENYPADMFVISMACNNQNITVAP